MDKGQHRLDSSRARRMVATMVHSTGHSDFGFARPAELCNMLFPNMSLGRSIPRDKAISSGRYHFERYCSWRQWQCARVGSTLGSITSRPRPQRTMSKREMTSSPSTCRRGNCPSGVISGGAIVAFETIPFKAVRAIWRFKSVKKGPVKDLRRIYSRVVESEICPGLWP